MSLTLYFLRHGQTALSRADQFCGSGLDPELTPEGVEMAEAFAASYSSRSWQAIYSSKLRRAVATAQPLCDAKGMNLRVSSGFNEIGYGDWEGRTKQEVEQKFKSEYLNWLSDPTLHAPTGGELAITVVARALGAITEIAKQFADGEVLIVSHKATIRIVLCQLLGIDVGDFRYRVSCPVGSVSVIEFASQGPMLQVLADRSHLSAKLRELPGT
ncbi:MAG TPA: histidine phosphatase family protein [Pyrinomonadaceae bacterium]|nr:histidine phosphatase family protein [Pyrinomonadaceae bacterium]